MSRAVGKTYFLPQEWYKSQEGEGHLSVIWPPASRRRKFFGLLEEPTLPNTNNHYEIFSYKLALFGRSGVGKTSVAARLSGSVVPEMHEESSSLQVSRVYWPCRLHGNSGKVVMMRLELWDVGSAALHRFEHFLPALKDKMDAAVFVFSCCDKITFKDLPLLMSRTLEPSDDVCKFIIGTKFDDDLHREVTLDDIRNFEQQWRLPVLRIHNSWRSHGLGSACGSSGDPRRQLTDELAPVLLHLCETLWQRDQALAGLVPSLIAASPPDSL